MFFSLSYIRLLSSPTAMDTRVLLIKLLVSWLSSVLREEKGQRRTEWRKGFRVGV